MTTLRYLTFLFLLGTVPLAAQVPYAARQATLASNFDLDGEAADDDQVVVDVLIADSASLTIAADPDICRLVDVTVTDADATISAGTLTIDGFDCWGYPLRVTYALTGGSGVRTGTVVAAGTGNVIRASGAFFSDVTTAVNGVITGEGVGDNQKIGYTTAPPKGWAMYGQYTSTPSGTRWVDIFGSYAVNVLVKNGALTTDVTAVSASTTAPFQNVAVGDILIFNIAGEVAYRRVATRADADTITINSGLTVPAAGVNFAYRKRFYSTDPQDGWIPVRGYDVVTFVVQVDLNANTGGVISSIECATITAEGSFGVPDVIFEEDTATVASAATGTDVSTVDLRLKPQYTHCRAGVRIATTDDADAANEDIDIVVGLRK